MVAKETSHLDLSMFFFEAAFGLSVSQGHDVIQGQYGNIALDGRNATQQGLQRQSEIRQLDNSIFLRKKLLAMFCQGWVHCIFLIGPS